MISSFTVDISIPLFIFSFRKYRSTFKMALDFLFCHLFTDFTLEFEAVPRNWQMYVYIDFRVVLYMRSLF